MADRSRIIERHIIGENGISYTLGADGLYYPDFRLPEGIHHEIGRYGRMRWEYLKNHRRGEHTRLLMDGKLNEHLHEIDDVGRIDEQCKECSGRDCGKRVDICVKWCGA